MLLLLLAAAHADELQLYDAEPLAYAAHLTLDPESPDFEGEITIDLTLRGRRRSVRLNAVGLELREGHVRAGALEAPVRFAQEEGSPVVTVSWPQALAGALTLEIQYSGEVGLEESTGLFRQDEGGRAYLYTQMEPVDARRVFPCLDQPDLRAPWTLSLTVPVDQRAFSNEPVEAMRSDGRWKTVTFLPTPPLPSYLVALAVGPFDVVELGRIGRGQAPARLLVPKGRADDTAYARETTEDVLTVFEDWFDQPYPFSKLDLVSVPRPLGWGAMEHPGLITFDQALIVSRPEDDTLPRQQAWVRVLAHELAHQWFGDLVTLAWWDDIWLNESFASWMELEAFDALHPEWDADVLRVNGRSSAMQQDALRSARRIREPIESWDDIHNAFDGITYAKGRAVLDMYEAWLGPEVFREGVLRYLDAHAWGVATADDFIEAVAGDDPALARSMRGFLNQAGAPLLRMQTTCDTSGAVIHVSQERYTPSGEPGRQRWRVPLVVSSGEAQARLMLQGRQGELRLESCPDPLMPNVGMKGYYRSSLEVAQLSALLTGGRSTAEQVGLLGDADALVSKGELLPGELLGLLPELLAGGERAVIANTLGLVSALDPLVPDDLRSAYQSFILETYGTLAEELGLDPAEGEDAQTTTLRPRLIRLVGRLGEHPGLLTEARPLAETWLETGEGLDPALVEVVLELAALGDDPALWARLRDLAREATDSERRSQLLGAMGTFRDPELVRAGLDLAISGEFELTEGLPLLAGPLGHPVTAEVAWTWFTEHLPAVEQAVPAPARGYLSWMGAGFCDLEHRDEVEAFLRPHASGWLGGERVLNQVVEGIEQCAASAEAQRPGVRAFLEGWAAE